MEIDIMHLTKKIAGVTILDDISYTFRSGSIYGLRGKNGCGKTMLMRSIAGLMKPTSGEIWINGKQLYKQLEKPESIGILIENPAFLPEYTGYQNLKLIADMRKNVTEQEVRDTIEALGLDSHDRRKYRKYSLGMKQRLGIAAAILAQPEIVILDEPINAIDEKGVASIRDILKAMKSDNRIIIIACHDREELDYLADIVLEMSEGKIIGGA